MKKTTSRILDSLSGRGYRITKTREEVCEILAGSPTPLSIQDVVAKSISDEASVYRTINLLQQESFIEEIVIKDSKSLFAITTHHHHHVVCRDCGKVAHVPCDSEPQAPTLPSFFTIDNHDLTYYGLCMECS